jgi:hypothetical protein
MLQRIPRNAIPPSDRCHHCNDGALQDEVKQRTGKTLHEFGTQQSMDRQSHHRLPPFA